MGACVGHSASSINATSTFTTNFYVADTGNERLVWLQRNSSGATWMGERSLPEGWRPVDCTTDHFGNVYVADEENSQIVKYTYNLSELTRYGTYGTGENNLNTFAHPHAVHVPFGIKTVGGQNVWYGEGRILTAEDWGPGSGALEHWLGVELPYTQPWSGTFASTVDFRITDHGQVTIEVLNSRGGHVRHLIDDFYPSGLHNAYWNLLDDNGNRVPEGFYKYRISVFSAYGCISPWCRETQTTSTFYVREECTDPEPFCPPAPDPINVALGLDDAVDIPHLPTEYRLGQAITPYVGPLFRIEGAAAPAAGAAGLSNAAAVASVRAHGIRALRVDVPAEDAPTRVTIRLYNLSGRLVKILADETLDPGSYLVGWDGADAAGRDVLPGVYIAHMTAGSYRGVQRLILR